MSKSWKDRKDSDQEQKFNKKMVLNKSKYEEEEENFNLEREIQSLSTEKEDETIEYIGSEEDFFAQRIDDTLTIYLGKKTNKIVGVCLSKTSDTLKLAESIYRLSKHIPLNDNSNNIKQDNKNHENGTSNPNTKPCLMCGKQLEPVFKDDEWKNYQPYNGGEVKFIFSYGSDFDNYVFRSVICDKCAEKHFHKMDKHPYVSKDKKIN